jgi:uncharacterized phiE125 gp8 family phage protein
MIEPRVVTAPVREPVTAAEVANAQRLGSLSADDTDLLTIYIGAARRYVEGRTARTINQTTLELALESFPSGEIVLPRATPLISVGSIIYRDSGAAYNTLAASKYVLDTTSEPGRVAPAYGESWPSFTPYPLAPIKIIYTAGAAETSPATDVAVDPRIKQLALLLTGHWWENREGVVITKDGRAMQFPLNYAIEDLISSLQVEYVV